MQKAQGRPLLATLGLRSGPAVAAAGSWGFFSSSVPREKVLWSEVLIFFLLFIYLYL